MRIPPSRVPQGARAALGMIHKLMKNKTSAAVVVAVVLIAVAAIAQTHPWAYSKDLDDKLTQRVAEIYTASVKIKPGMTRAVLLKIFTREGGASSPQRRCFVYPSCPYVKVDVEFAVPETRQEELPSDVITKISKPYLESPRYD